MKIELTIKSDEVEYMKNAIKTTVGVELIKTTREGNWTVIVINCQNESCLFYLGRRYEYYKIIWTHV